MINWHEPQSLKIAILGTGLHKREFASRVGVSVSQINRLIAGPYKPTFETRERIESFLRNHEVSQKRKRAQLPGSIMTEDRA